MTFGSQGTEAGQFSSDLADLAVDAQGNLYVTDRSIGLQKFDSSGQFVAKWESCGDDKRMTGATGVATDSQGNIYVYDLSNSRICKFDPDGNPLAAWGGLENAVGFIAVDRQGDIYVAEPFNDLVKKFHQR